MEHYGNELQAQNAQLRLLEQDRTEFQAACRDLESTDRSGTGSEEVTPLLNRDIGTRQARLCRTSQRVDIATYNVHIGWVGPFLTCKQTRLIIGAPEVHGERQAVITSSARSIASAYPRVEVRMLLGSHIKLMIFAKANGLSAIIGSQNLGLGHPFELAVELRGEHAISLANIYQRLWKEAIPVKALDMQAIASRLRTSEFEVPR